MKWFNLFDNYLTESKANIEEYENINYTGLVVKEYNRNGSITKKLTLYDFKENKIIAHIELMNFSDGENFEVQRVFSEKGYGPRIYEFALMSVFPSAVIPSKTIKDAAIKVWKYFYTNRTDVVKIDMNKNDSNLFANIYSNDGEIPKHDENLKYINCYYFLDKSNEYDKLVEKGNILLKSHKITPSTIFLQADKQFNRIMN